MDVPAVFLRTNVAGPTPWTSVLNVAVTLLPTGTAVVFAAGVKPVTVGALTVAATEYSKRFGVPAPAAVITPAVAFAASVAATCAGVSDGFWESSTAAAPAVWGEAIDVPDMDAVAVVEV